MKMPRPLLAALLLATLPAFAQQTRIADLPASRLPELLAWEWKRIRQAESSALMLAA